MTANGTYYSFIYYPRLNQGFRISFSRRNDDRMQVLVYCGGLLVRHFYAKCVHCSSTQTFYKRFNSVMTFAELKTYVKNLIKRELVAKKET